MTTTTTNHTAIADHLKGLAESFLASFEWTRGHGVTPADVLEAWYYWYDYRVYETDTGRNHPLDCKMIEVFGAEQFTRPDGKLVFWKHVAFEFQIYMHAAARHAVYVDGRRVR